MVTYPALHTGSLNTFFATDHPSVQLDEYYADVIDSTGAYMRISHAYGGSTSTIFF
jgi:hypothetical protein